MWCDMIRYGIIFFLFNHAHLVFQFYGRLNPSLACIARTSYKSLLKISKISLILSKAIIPFFSTFESYHTKRFGYLKKKLSYHSVYRRFILFYWLFVLHLY